MQAPSPLSSDPATALLGLRRLSKGQLQLEWSEKRGAAVGSVRSVGLPLQTPERNLSRGSSASPRKLPSLNPTQFKLEEPRETDRRKRRNGKVGKKERMWRRATPLSLVSPGLSAWSLSPGWTAGLEPASPGAAEPEALPAPAEGSLSSGKAGDRWPEGAGLPPAPLRMLRIDRA